MVKDCVLIGASLLKHVETRVMAQHLAKSGESLVCLGKIIFCIWWGECFVQAL